MRQTPHRAPLGLQGSFGARKLGQLYSRLPLGRRYHEAQSALDSGAPAAVQCGMDFDCRKMESTRKDVADALAEQRRATKRQVRKDAECLATRWNERHNLIELPRHSRAEPPLGLNSFS
jgi:hypothetical protein